LDSLEIQTYENLKVYVIENGCEVEWLPVESRLHLSTNIGVAGGYNVGLRSGRDSGYTLLLNNDVAADKEMVSRLVDLAETDSHIGIVSPRIYYYGTNRIWFDGGSLNPWTGVSRHQRIRKVTGNEEVHETDWATGCAMLIKSEVIEKVGFFDKVFSPGYGEDLDYSMRVRAAGYKIMVNPKAKLWHKISQSIGILQTET
jgi:hypothetical protein